MDKCPKWARPERQDHLVQLFVRYGNQCLLGHTACHNPEHYVHDYGKSVLVPHAVNIPCQDTHGNPIRDEQGNQLYVTVYKLVRDFLHDRQVRKVDMTGDGDLHLCGLYELKAESIIKDWIADDRAQAQADWQAEYEARHRDTDRRFPVRGNFNAISKEVFYDSQPQYYLEAIGMNALTLQPFAKVRLASSWMGLHVDLQDSLKGLSKSKKRKAIRYGKIPREVKDRVEDTCWQAVKDYFSH